MKEALPYSFSIKYCIKDHRYCMWLKGKIVYWTNWPICFYKDAENMSKSNILNGYL